MVIAYLMVPTIGTAMPFVAIYAGMTVASRSKRAWVGWAVGLLMFLAMGLGMALLARSLRADYCRNTVDFYGCFQN